MIPSDSKANYSSIKYRNISFSVTLKVSSLIHYTGLFSRFFIHDEVVDSHIWLLSDAGKSSIIWKIVIVNYCNTTVISSYVRPAKSDQTNHSRITLLIHIDIHVSNSSAHPSLGFCTINSEVYSTHEMWELVNDQTNSSIKIHSAWSTGDQSKGETPMQAKCYMGKHWGYVLCVIMYAVIRCGV